MPDREALKDLIERVEKATGPDREIDCLLADMSDLIVDGVVWRSIMQHGLEFAVRMATRYQSVWFTALPYYSSSIDAALSLVERVRPGWHWYVDDRTAAVWPEGVYDESDVAAATPALSIILALLNSLTSGDSNA